MKINIVERKIMWGDLDSLGIVFYPRFYEWMDAAGHLFFESVGLALNKMWRDRKLLFGLVETSCRYLQPGRYHQEIRIATRLEAMDQKTALLNHVITDGASGTLLVEGFEKRICLDVSHRDQFRAIPIPDDMATVLKEAMRD